MELAGGCQDGKLIPGRKQEAAALVIVGRSSCLRHLCLLPRAHLAVDGAPAGRPDLAVAARESMVPCGRRCKEKSYRDNTTPNRLISLSAPARNRLAVHLWPLRACSCQWTRQRTDIFCSLSLAAGTTVACSPELPWVGYASCRQQLRGASLQQPAGRGPCRLRGVPGVPASSCTPARQVDGCRLAMEVWTVQDMQTTHLVCVCPCRVCANGPENYCLY